MGLTRLESGVREGLEGGGGAVCSTVGSVLVVIPGLHVLRTRTVVKMARKERSGWPGGCSDRSVVCGFRRRRGCGLLSFTVCPCR